MKSDTGCVTFMLKDPDSYTGYYIRRSFTREMKFPFLECDLEYSLRTSEHLGLSRCQPTLNLSILATCKQIYQECWLYLWKNNAFLLKGQESLRQVIEPKWCASYLLRHVEHIALGIQMIGNGRLEEEFRRFEFLDQLSQSAKLKNITVFTRSWDTLESYCGAWNTGFGEYMEMLNKASKGPLAKLEKKMILYAGYQGLSFRGRQTRIRHLAKNPTKVMDDLHDSFGGELWIDGILCYKDGNRLQEPFKYWGFKKASWL